MGLWAITLSLMTALDLIDAPFLLLSLRRNGYLQAFLVRRLQVRVLDRNLRLRGMQKFNDFVMAAVVGL